LISFIQELDLLTLPQTWTFTCLASDSYCDEEEAIWVSGFAYSLPEKDENLFLKTMNRYNCAPKFSKNEKKWAMLCDPKYAHSLRKVDEDEITREAEWMDENYYKTIKSLNEFQVLSHNRFDSNYSS